jgi:hypothetical protein
MYLTKNYFNKFQFTIVGILLLFAVGVGSLQSFLIVRAIRRNTH